MSKRRSKKLKAQIRAQKAAKITAEVVKVEPQKRPRKKFLQKLFMDWFFIASLLMLLLIFAIGIIGVDVKRNTQRLEEKMTAQHGVEQQKKKWEGIVSKYPNYRDGYFKAAQYEYQLGDKKKALANVQQALFIDPNFEIGRKFEAFLKSKQ